MPVGFKLRVDDPVKSGAYKGEGGAQGDRAKRTRMRDRVALVVEAAKRLSHVGVNAPKFRRRVVDHHGLDSLLSSRVGGIREDENSARTYGKSDPIDALAVARAALREPDLPTAELDGPTRELRLLVDHREDLVQERIRCVNRLRWHLHELDATWDPPKGSLTRVSNLDAVAARLDDHDGTVTRIASEIVDDVRRLTVRERALAREIDKLTLAPTLLAIPGVGPLSATTIVAETADVRRFKSKDAFVLEVPPERTWSCEAAEGPCGTCPSCQDRSVHDP